jgi:hypothetical protein
MRAIVCKLIRFGSDCNKRWFLGFNIEKLRLFWGSNPVVPQQQPTGDWTMSLALLRLPSDWRMSL